MDWSHYYATLETWVSEQYRSFESTRNNLLNMAMERERFIQAQCLALSKYGAEMRNFQHRTPQSVPSTDARSSVRDNEQRPRNRFRRYAIPHPWRRIAAELIDSIFVLCIKLFLISLIKNESSFTDIFRYFGLNVLSSAPEYRTFRRARLWANSEFRRRGLPSSRFEKLLSLLQNDVEDEIEVYDLDLLFLIDHLGRFLSALVEAVFISYCFFGRGPGGATIGKWLMNLQVVSCDEVIPLPDMVEVSPGTHLGFARALVRSMLKGTSFLTVFSFFCMLFFQYHRCTYDIIAGTLVVQPVPTPINPTDDNQPHEPERRQQ